jgi:hypothetical protein
LDGIGVRSDVKKTPNVMKTHLGLCKPMIKAPIQEWDEKSNKNKCNVFDDDGSIPKG